MDHPFKNLKIRQNGFGVAAGHEKPYIKGSINPEINLEIHEMELYSSLPHSGYYGIGLGSRPFRREQASYSEEVSWYRTQYGESTETPR
jgi:hypothetical protein